MENQCMLLQLEVKTGQMESKVFIFSFKCHLDLQQSRKHNNYICLTVHQVSSWIQEIIVVYTVLEQLAIAALIYCFIVSSYKNE